MNPFTLDVRDLTNLGQDRAVEFFRRLLWAEAARAGIGRDLITVPQCINVGDGGIDAYIENAHPSNDEVIPRGNSGFQIKSADLTPEECRKELHQDGNPTKPFKSEVKKILDAGGIYVLVLLADITTEKKGRRIKALQEELTRRHYRKSQVRVYTADQLVGFAERFPALVTWFMNELSQCLPYSSWADRKDVKVPGSYIFDIERQKWADEVRHILRNPGSDCPVFRVVGLSGIGKTRLVFETLAPDDLSHRVLYVNADQFRLSSLYNTLQNDSNLSAILVIDECNLQQHEEFVRSFSARGPRLAILTMSFDFGSVAPPTRPYDLKQLANDTLEEILKKEAPQLPENVISRLSKFADGYPRIALLLSESYLMNGSAAPESLIVTDDALFDRLVGGGADTTSEHFRKTKRVLMWLSIFSKVGFEGKLAAESKWLVGQIGISWQDYAEIISEQRERGIIQGKYYVYVTPFMLKVHHQREWWQSHGMTKDDFDTFVASIPEEFRVDLLKRFVDQVPYISSTTQGREFAKDLLGLEGPFIDGALLKTEVGADFFLKLTEADPSTALECLRRTILTWSTQELSEFETGRREVVWALEKIAVWKDHFADAARILIRLAGVENERWANNSTGVFISLFSPAPGRVAPTEASPEQRFPILVECLNSASKEQRKLGLKACDRALESEHFSRFVGAEHQGLRKEPDLWSPKTYGELFDAYRRVWHLIVGRLGDLPEDERTYAMDILLRRASSLIGIQNLSEMVVDTLVELKEAKYVENSRMLAEVLQILHYRAKDLTKETRGRLEALRDQLTGSDFSSLLKRYVGMDLIEDKFDEQGNMINQTLPQIQQLAQQAIENTGPLKTEMRWLLTVQAQNGYHFGFELGKRDIGFSILSSVVDALRSFEGRLLPMFLGGYFRAMFENEPERWEAQLGAFAADPVLRTWVPELTWRSGMSDRAALRVLGLAEDGSVALAQLRMFGLGGVFKKVSEPVLEKWIRFLLGTNEIGGISTALELVHSYYVWGPNKQVLPKEPTRSLLLHRSFFEKGEEKKQFDQMVDFEWSQIAQEFILTYPEESLGIAEQLLEHMGEKGTIIDGFHDRSLGVLSYITSVYPIQVWRIASKLLGPPLDTRAFHIKEWLRGGNAFQPESEGILSHIPLNELWKWVDADVEKRAWYLAYFVPRVLPRKGEKKNLAREVLVRYGNREDVRRNLMANLSSEGWTGHASAHYEDKRRRLQELRKNEDNQNVILWLDEFIASLDQDIERERIKEEREGH